MSAATCTSTMTLFFHIAQSVLAKGPSADRWFDLIEMPADTDVDRIAKIALIESDDVVRDTIGTFSSNVDEPVIFVPDSLDIVGQVCTHYKLFSYLAQSLNSLTLAATARSLALLRFFCRICRECWSEIAKINKKASKCGQCPVTYRAIKDELIRISPADSFPVVMEKFTTVEIQDSEAPCIQGWQFIASLEHTEAGNIVRRLTEQDLDQQYRTRQVCDHCGLERRRKDSYIIQKDGDTKQVGRQCLQLFFPGTDAQSIARWLESLSALERFCEYDPDQEESFGGSGPRHYLVLDILTLAAACQRLYGFVSRTRAFEQEKEEGIYTGPAPTADRISLYYNPGSESKPSDYIENVTDADKATAEATLAWIRALNPRGDYEHNLKVYSELESTNEKGFGILASAVAVKAKADQKLAEQRRNSKSVSHFGEVNKRGTFDLTLMGVQNYETEYGVGHIFRFEDREGNHGIYFTSSDLFKTDWYQYYVGYDALIGKTFKITATIKEHGEYKGNMQTVLQRAKAIVIKHQDLAGYNPEECDCPSCKEKRFPVLKQQIEAAGGLLQYYIRRTTDKDSWSKPEDLERNFNYHMGQFQFSSELSDEQTKTMLSALYINY